MYVQDQYRWPLLENIPHPSIAQHEIGAATEDIHNTRGSTEFAKLGPGKPCLPHDVPGL